MFSREDWQATEKLKVEVFCIKPTEQSYDKVELERLINNKRAKIVRTETAFDKSGNYLVAVWYKIQEEPEEEENE